MLSVGAWAQNVAKIGTTEYATLADAVAAVPTNGTATTITMLEDADITTALTIANTQNVVIDLNGKTVKNDASKSLAQLITVSGKLTINDSSEPSTGVIKNTASAKYVIKTGTAASVLTLNNGTIQTTTGNGNGAVYGTSGSFVMTGGKIIAAGTGVTSKNVNISGGEINATAGQALCAAGAVTGGKFTSANNNAVYANQSGNLEITGGEFTGVSSKPTINIYSTDVKVTGTTLANGVGFASNATAMILPGTDNANLTNTHAEFYDGETLIGYAPINTGLLASSKVSGKTVKLIKDVATTTYLNVTKSFTLDLNGHNIACTPAKADAAILTKGTTSAPVELTIKGEGKVSCADHGEGCNAVQVSNYVKLNIEGGEFSVPGDNAAIYIVSSVATNPSSVTITDGYFESGDGKWIVNCKDDAYKNGGANILIKGGSFSADPSQFLSEGVGTNFLDEAYTAVQGADGKYTVQQAFAAKIGDTKYATLAAAISAAQNGETVTLLTDVTENIVVPAGKEITLDLNGKTLSGGSVASNGKNAAIVNNGTIIIQDSSAEQTGTIKREDDDTSLSASNSYYVIDNQGTMTIKSGNVMNKAGVPGAHKGSSLIRNGEVAEGAVLNIEGGTLTQDNFDVIKNGGKNSVLNITGGTINSANSYAILSYDKVNMSDGEVNGNVCFRSYSDEDGDSHGVGNITGGTINGNITVETYPGNTPKILSECNISGDAVINGTLSIGEGNGKTFTANDEKGTIAVSGGTFANPVPEKYCADGYIPTANNDGKYGVKPGSYVAQIDDVKYESLSEAVAAATDGEASTITLLTDVIENITIPAGKNITLDLNSNTLNGKKVANTPTIKNQGTLTLKNGNVRREGEGSASWYVIENEGTITMDEGLNVEGCASSSLIRNNAATAQMTFNAGTYTQTGAFIVVKNDLGNVVINGGTFSTATDKNVLNNWDQMTINGGTFTGNLFNGAYDTDNNKLTVNDGTFNTSQIRTYLGNGKTLCPIEIKGGTFADAQMKYVGTDNKESDTDVQVAVSGGTFANPVPEKYCATDFIPNDNADGTYGVKEGSYIARIDEQGYETLDEAIEAAKQTETATTINLLDNAETTKEVLPENVTIDANGKVLTMPSFVVLDGQAYTLPNITGAVTYKVHKATYIRTNISKTVWGTVCLPFSLTSGNGATYYTFNNISGNTLTVDETTETVNPHTPVVFNKAAGDLEINETNAIVSLVTPGELKNGALIGTYTSATIPADDGNFYFINGDRFHQVQASLSVPMYRAYINNASSGGAKPRVLSIVVNEDATAIDVVDADANAEIIAIYDASGRKLNAPQKGMNIMKLQNGKTVKLLVK